MFSSTSYAEWTKLGKNVDGDTFYMDFDRIREVDGYVYFWRLTDYLKPTKFGHLSAKVYIQGDCKRFRFKNLSATFHKEPMGGGTVDRNSPQNPEWVYPPPNSTGEAILKSVCEFTK